MRAIAIAEHSAARGAAAGRSGFSRRFTRCALVLSWLMVFVLPVQGFAAVVQGVWMPAHRHSQSLNPQSSAASLVAQRDAQTSHDQRDAMRVARHIFRTDAAPPSPQVLIKFPLQDQAHSELHDVRLPHHHGVERVDVSITGSVDDQISITEAVKHLFDGFDLASGVLPLAALPGHARPPLAGELTYLPPQPVTAERPPKA